MSDLTLRSTLFAKQLGGELDSLRCRLSYSGVTSRTSVLQSSCESKCKHVTPSLGSLAHIM
eukprot:6288592-Amphidinium_carterae.1